MKQALGSAEAPAHITALAIAAEDAYEEMGNVDEVLKVALTKGLKRVEWVEVDQISKQTARRMSIQQKSIEDKTQLRANG